jgi:hypothetical protein
MKLKIGEHWFFCLDVTIRAWENGIALDGDVLGSDGKVYSVRSRYKGIEGELTIQRVDKIELGG